MRPNRLMLISPFISNRLGHLGSSLVEALDSVFGRRGIKSVFIIQKRHSRDA